MPPPLSIIEGCKYDFSVVAAMAGLKFAFHVPTYRQQDWFAQCGWFPSRSTVNDLMNYAVATIGPLYQQMWQLLLAQPILLGDDTTLCVLLRDGLGEEDLEKLSTRNRFRRALDAGLPSKTGLPGSATSYAWLYTSLAGLAPYNVFHWSLTHQNAVIDGHLATYRGVFVGDAAGATRVCSNVPTDGSFTPVAICTPAANSSRPRRTIRSWRRKPFRSTSSCMMSKSGARRWMPPHATSCGARGGADLEPHATLIGWRCGKAALPRGRIGEALGYLRNQWSALTVYLGDPRIRIDNAQSEQIIRPLTVGRNNWQFLGHPQAAAGRLQGRRPRARKAPTRSSGRPSNCRSARPVVRVPTARPPVAAVGAQRTDANRNEHRSLPGADGPTGGRPDHAAVLSDQHAFQGMLRRVVALLDHRLVNGECPAAVERDAILQRPVRHPLQRIIGGQDSVVNHDQHPAVDRIDPAWMRRLAVHALRCLDLESLDRLPRQPSFAVVGREPALKVF